MNEPSTQQRSSGQGTAGIVGPLAVEGTSDEREEQVRSLRETFIGHARELLDAAEARLNALQTALDHFAGRNDNNAWAKHKFAERCGKLRDQTRALREWLHLRPTLCVAGRRGVGKSTLIATWCDADELRGLPVGKQDTTACLTRLTMQPRHSPDSLEIHLFQRNEVTDKRGGLSPADDYPDNIGTEVLLLALNDRSLNVCRFPGNEDATQSYVVDRSERGIVRLRESERREGTISLDQIQWYAKEVVVPVSKEGSSGSALTNRVLRVADIVDSPGGDANYDRERPWKERKNNLVFALATQRIDVLVVTAACLSSGYHMGGQIQSEIIRPWEQRCSANPRNRLLAVLTHSAALLESAQKVIEERTAPNERIDFYSDLQSNLIRQLYGGDSEQQPLVRPRDLSTWPYFFFVENERAGLKDFQEGIEPGQGQAVAARLWGLLQSDDETKWQSLPLGQRCIIWMAKTCQEADFVGSEQVKALQKWVIEGMCALLDDHDRGYTRLTDFVVEYLGRGPVAITHLEERLDGCNSIVNGLNRLIEEMADPQASQARDQLDKLCRRISEATQGNSVLARGSRLRLGNKCKDLFKRVDDYGRLGSNEPRLTIDDAWRAVVDDVLESAKDWLDIDAGSGTNDAGSDRRHAAEILLACLSADRGLKPLLRRLQGFHEKPNELNAHLVAALERLARIILYLGEAASDQEKKKAILEHCLQITAESSELAPFLRQLRLHEMPAELTEKLGQVKQSADRLRAELEKDVQPRPFELPATGEQQAATA